MATSPRDSDSVNFTEGGASMTNHPFFGTSSISHVDDDGGPEKLYSILEQAVPRPDETLLLSPEEIQRRREYIEATWDQVRQWLRRHESPEERSAAAYVRGQGDTTPLHLICKINNPPTDIVSEIVEAAVEVVGWVDNHRWLPLHHACANGVSTDVLLILTQAYPDSKIAQDNNCRTPLHFYATRNLDSPMTMARNVAILCDNGAAQIPDHGGMLPMHYACAYGTSPAVLQVLADANPESITAKENRGRTPMHLAMVNAPRDTSPGVISFLLENAGPDAVNVRDTDGNLPLHLLNLGLKTMDTTIPESLNNVSECLKLYLAAKPYPSPDFLAALQDLPDWLQDVAVVTPHVRHILNMKIIQRFPTSILMLDGIMYIAIIFCFEIATTEFIKSIDDPPENVDPAALNILFVAAVYFLLREFAQVVASLALGAFTSWLYDTTNWLDALVITLVTYFSIIMKLGDPLLIVDDDNATTIVDDDNANTIVDDDNANTKIEAFRRGAAVTKGILWIAVIYFLKSTRVDFAVFLNGVFYVCKRLVAFLLAVLVILILFGQMFWIVYLQTDICPCSHLNDNETSYNECLKELGLCNFIHCQSGHSFLKVYTMMAGEIASETRYYGNLFAQILYILYGFVVVILLSNVLIAIVTDSYEVVQNDRAAIVFWSNRLDFIAEMDGIASVVKRRIFLMGKDESSGEGSTRTTQEQANGNVSVSSGLYPSGGHERFRDAWKSIISTFEKTPYDDADLTHGNNVEFWVTVLYKIIAIFLIPLWLFVGFISIGILWPPQVREWLFVQKKTVESRSEIERKKLEKLRTIQSDMKTLKSEIRKEMQNDREEMFRMKAEVDAVQSEVLSDLQQVRDLMNTLLNLNDLER